MPTIEWDKPEAPAGGSAIQWDAEAAPKNAAQPTSFTAGVVQGFRDPLDALAQLLERGAASLGLDTDAVNKALGMPSAEASARGATQAYTETFGGAPSAGGRLVGNVLATAPLAAAMPVGATIPRAIGWGAAGGAASGALQPVEQPKDFWSQKAEQLLTGAAAGGATGGLVSGVGRMFRPNTDPRVALLRQEGIHPTPGQIMGQPFQTTESLSTSLPGFGEAVRYSQRQGINELNTALYRRALEPIGGQVPTTVGREAVRSVRDQLNSAYNALIPRLQFQPGPQFNFELSNLRNMAASLPRGQADEFTRIFDEQITKLGPLGRADGETLKNVQSKLRVLSQEAMRSQDPDVRHLGRAYAEMGNIFRRQIERVNPQYAQQLAAIDQGWKQYAVIRTAAGRQGATEGIVTPAQLNAAVRNMDPSYAKAEFAGGRANMQDLSDAARGVLAQNYPESGTTTRAAMAGAALGAFAPQYWLGAGLGSLPYLPYGRQAASALMAGQRPQAIQDLGQIIQQLSAPLAAESPYVAQYLSR